jgi:ABC-type multidrug transport system fused ATPase/permease subunit
VIAIYRKLLDLLDGRERTHFFALMGLVVVMGIFDMLGAATILPFLAVVTNPSLIETNRLLALLYDWTDPGSTQTFLVFLGGLVFAAVILSLMIKLATMYAIARFTQMRRYSLSSRLLEGYLRQPYVWFLSQHSSNLGKQVLQEVMEVVTRVMSPAMRILSQVISMLFLLTLLVIVEPVVAIVSAAVIAAIYGTVFFFLRKTLTRLGQTRYDANAEQFRVTAEMMGGIKDVKLAGLEKSYLRRYRAPARRLSRTAIHMQVIGETPRYVLETVAFGGMIGVILAMMVREGGDLTAALPVLGLFAVASIRMFPAIQQIYQSLSTLRGGRPSLDALHRDITSLRITGQNLHDAHRVPPLPLRERLEVRDAWFNYPGTERSALRGFDLTIRANTTIGIVGGTGAGKTTAIDLILGLLSPERGEVLVDGIPVSRETLRGWQNNIGYVPQHIYLIDDSVAANIAFGIEPGKIDMEAVERAARLAELHGFVMEELPEGYQTHVGERGVRLSGGQRQRIGIARALYSNPDVLILDEATSALDNLTERAVMDAVRNLGHAKTIIMIAHRLSTVRRCDEIFLMEHGRVAASGAYEDLIEKNSTFREMARAS